MTAKIPEGFQTATTILAYKDCPQALAWYEKAFGAETRKCLKLPDGKVVHAELVLGTSLIVLTDELPFAASKAPRPGCLTSEMYLYVADCDAFVARAAAAGAKVTMTCRDMFYGDRIGALEDPFGHVWTVATHLEDVSPAEWETRMKAWAASEAGGKP